jgi:hypothetical protein
MTLVVFAPLRDRFFSGDEAHPDLDATNFINSVHLKWQ